MASQSPLRAKPLPVPGESLDREIEDLLTDIVVPYYMVAALATTIATMEWFGYLTHSARYPMLFSAVAVTAIVVTVWRFRQARRRAKNLRQGRDGERCVGQYLDLLVEEGARVFHDVPGTGFNLDHVVISPRGIFAIETKTWSKPSPDSTITVEGNSVLVAGRIPERNPIIQVTAAARWLAQTLEESTGKRFAVRGVVLFPGWFVEQRSARGPVWVLEPKMLPGFIEQEQVSLRPDDVKLAAFHLSRYVRTEVGKLR